MQTQTINKIVFPSSSTCYISNDNGRLTIRQNDDVIIHSLRLRPLYDRQTDLGSSTIKWKNLYLQDSIINANGSITVDDLINAVAYLKNQGYIS